MTIFRDSAMERLTSPEQLDQRIRIISRGNFLGLIAILLLVIAALVWAIFGTVSTTVSGPGYLTNDLEGVSLISAEQPGVVEEVLLRPGDGVKKGDALLRLVQDGKETEVTSLVEGTIIEMRAAEGQFIPAGTAVSTVTSGGDDYFVLALLPPAAGKRIVEGMQVNVVPSTVSQEEYGSMPGTVVGVSERPVSLAEVQTFLQDEQLTEILTGGSPRIVVEISLQEDDSTTSGFKWNTGSGPPFAITPGTLSSAEVIIAEQAPITLVLPYLETLLGR